MSEVTQEFMLEQFCRIRADIAELKEFMISLEHRQRNRQNTELDRPRARLERIEKRLDLVE